MLAALGAERSLLPVELYDNGVPHVYVALASEDEVARLEPDLKALERLAPRTDSVVGFNAFAGAGLAWKTRMFAPADGVPEDPATGSAAGPLACHLCRHGLVPFGEEVVISQGAEIGRPSTLHARAEGTRRADRARRGRRLGRHRGARRVPAVGAVPTGRARGATPCLHPRSA